MTDESAKKIEEKIGSTVALETNAKDCLVSAVNEVHRNVQKIPDPVPKSGGKMSGNLDMGGKEIQDVMNIKTRAVYLKDPNTGADVSLEATSDPGVVRAFCARNVQTGKNKDGSIIFRGVSDPEIDQDAMNLRYARNRESVVESRSRVAAYAQQNGAGRRNKRAMISFMDDDGDAAVYSVLYDKVIKPTGIPYTLAIPPASIGTAGKLTWAELLEMYNAGVDVSCHHLKEYHMIDDYANADAYAADLAACAEMFRQRGILDVDTVSYPNGAYVEDYIPVVKQFHKMGFTVERGINETPYESYFMKRCEVFPKNGAYPATDALTKVDEVVANGGWLIFMTHCWYPTFDAEFLKYLIQYIQQKEGVEIVGVNEALAMTGNVIEVGHFRKPLADATKPYFVVDYEGGVWVHEIHVGGSKAGSENVELTMESDKWLSKNTGMMIATGSNSPEYQVSEPVDVSDCASVIVTGWAYDNYYAYAFYNADGSFNSGFKCPDAYSASAGVDHVSVTVPAGAKTIRIATNTYKKTAALTKVYTA